MSIGIGRSQMMASLYAVGRSRNEQGNVMQQMATGSRLNRAAAGPSDSAIAAVMQAQTRAIDTAVHNIQDTGNLIQTADSAMGNIQSALLENRDLAVRSGNAATLTAGDQARIDQQYQANVAEVDRGANAATFNTLNLLDGGYGTRAAQVGPDAGPVHSIDVSLEAADAAALGVAGTSVADTPGAGNAIAASDQALNQIADQRAEAGVTQRRLQSAQTDLGAQGTNMAAARSRLADLDFADAAARRDNAGLQTTIALFAQKQQNQLGAMSSLL